MLAFATGFFAALLLGMGARDQILVAALSLRLGKRISLLLTALMASILASMLGVWAGQALAAYVPRSWQPLLVGLALTLAGLEMILRRAGLIPEEPTRSLGAMGLAAFLVQVFDAVRIVLFGLVLAAALPLATLLGLVAGALVAVSLGWSGGARLLSFPLLRWRRIVGVLLAAAGTLALILR